MRRSLLSAIAAGAVALLVTHAAGADAPHLKIGLVSTLSGNFTQAGKAGDAAFFKAHGDTVAGRKVQIIKRR